MFNYSYTARDDYGKSARGMMMAEDEIDLANKISKLGHFLIHAKIVTGSVITDSGFPRLKPKEVLNFTIHISTLIGAGVTLMQGLKDMEQDAEKESIKKIIADIRYRIETGYSLKDAILVHSKTFSPLYVAVVETGESTGKLSSCLNDLVDFLDWQLELRARVTEAATYPIILFCIMVGVVTLLVVKVIPVFEPIFKEVGVNLPLPTQIVLGVSHFIRQFWYIIIGVLISLGIGYKLYNSTTGGRYVFDSLKLKLPIFGQLLRKVALSRFCHTLALALRSGGNILSALDMAGAVMGNQRLVSIVKKARDSVNVGEKLASSLGGSKEFPPMVTRMIAVGEQSGGLTETLDRVNQFYDREVPATIKRLFALFEPIMIVLMGVIVGGIALSIFLPLFQMANLIGG